MKENFAIKLRELRKASGMTQEQLAAEFGVSVQAVSKWETAASYPDIELMPRIADLFGVSLDELLRDVKNEKSIEAGEEIHTDAEQQCKRRTARRQRKGYIRRRISQFSDTVSDKNLVNHIIERSHQHCHNTGNGKFTKKPPYRLHSQWIICSVHILLSFFSLMLGAKAFYPLMLTDFSAYLILNYYNFFFLWR